MVMGSPTAVIRLQAAADVLVQTGRNGNIISIQIGNLQDPEDEPFFARDQFCLDWHTKKGMLFVPGHQDQEIYFYSDGIDAG
jgi:hypothetical protein